MEQNLEIKTKGCVYFFRHIGLTPVKIGFSNNESPISRFDQFKTYAPYGSEILGFIQTFDAKELETTLHERFSQHRLNGEWFEITQEQCENVINFYSNIEDIKEKNDFQIAWAKHIANKKAIIAYLDEKSIYDIPDKIVNTQNRRDYIENIFRKNPNLPIKHVAKLAGCSKKTVYQYKKSVT